MIHGTPSFHGTTASKPVHAIIPARYASSRFPGKPLVLLHGKPMFCHVWERANRCKQLASVTLATDDSRIATIAKNHAVPYVMTANDHESGTDRIFEAATLLNLDPDSIIINIQGDEPALDPRCLDSLIATFHDQTVCAATLARYATGDEAISPDVVKVVIATSGDALYFSRAPIPYSRDGQSHNMLAHMGIYAFTFSTLKRFVKLVPSSLELTERLEQLRFLENSIPIRVTLTNYVSFGIDRPEDIERVLPYLA